MMETRKVSLAELETEARAKEERKIAEAEAHASAEAKAQKEAGADLAADVSDWLSDTVGLDPDSVLPFLSVSLNAWRNALSCALALESHVPITWDMVVKEEGLEVQGRNPYMVCDLHHATLAGALLRSSDEWAAQKERQERVVEQEASEAASWEAHKQKQIAQGQHYLDLIASYPILGPILEMLAIYVGNMQEYENDMAAAGSYHDEIQEEMAAKMRTAMMTRCGPTSMISTNSCAYPFQHFLPGGNRFEWRVWRPDQVPHHHGHYATEVAAQRAADRINRQLMEKETERGKIL